MHLVVMQVVLWNAPDFFSIFSVIFVSDDLVESRGPVCQKIVKKQCINDPKKSYFLLCFPMFYAHCISKPSNAR